jgi:quercetin dioxygenase-like cupin family protein
MHTAEIVSEAPVTIVEVELKKQGAGGQIQNALDPVKLDPQHYHVELENDQVRVLRVKLGPHESTPQHAHSLNRVVVYLRDGKLRITTPEGKVTEAEHKAGDITWAAGPARHKDENPGEQPMELIAIDLKN